MPPEDKIAELQALVDSAEPEAPSPTMVINVPVEPAPKAGNPVNRDKPELPAYIVAIIAIIAITVLILTSNPVPDILNVATLSALGIGAAVTSPGVGK